VGGSFLRSGSINLNLMPKHVQEEILELLFHPTKGAQFTLGKVPIGGSDAVCFLFSFFFFFPYLFVCLFYLF
jgi:hypothetical protein